MIFIKAPRFDINDDKAKLVKWLINDGDKVEDGITVAILETSKATFDVVVDKGGFLKTKAVVGEEYSCDDVLGNIFETKEEMLAFQKNNPIESAPKTISAIILSKGAQKLVTEKGITDLQIKDLGKQIVREADILNLISRHENPTKEQNIVLTKHQRAVAKTVLRSHHEIPAAFVTMRIYCDKLLNLITDLKARDGMTMLSIPEVLVYSIGKLNKEYATFYGSYIDEDFIPADQNCSIGVTFDVGRGLFLPKLPEVNNKNLKEITQWFALSRAKAMRNSFKQEDLKPADISLSINTEKDVEFFVPFIFPPQVCIFSMGSILNDYSAKYFLLGLAYDHRVNNGSRSVQFLKAIKGMLEGDFLNTLGKF